MQERRRKSEERYLVRYMWIAVFGDRVIKWAGTTLRINLLYWPDTNEPERKQLLQ